MRRSRRALGLVALLCGGALALSGCGGSADGDSQTGPVDTQTTSPAPTPSAFTPAQVEKMIARSIRPTLAANLGAGSTVKVDCARDGEGFRCDTGLFEAGKRVEAVHVIYAVTCTKATCSWIPVG